MDTVQSFRKFLVAQEIYQKSEDYWELKLPFIIPPGTASDIEEILYSKRHRPQFRLGIVFYSANEFPLSLDEYLAHEASLVEIAVRITQRKYTIDFVISGANHYSMLNNEWYDWSQFLDEITCVNHKEYVSYSAVYRGLEVRHLRLLLSEDQFRNHEEDIVSAYLTHERSLREFKSAHIMTYTLDIPVASIIQMSFSPELCNSLT